MFNRVISQHCSRQWLGIEQEKCIKSMNFGNRCWWISFTLNCVTTGRYHYQWDSQWVTGKQSILTGIRYRILEYLLSPWCGRTHQVVVRRRTRWITPNLKPTIGVDFTDDSYLISRSDARIFLIISQNKMIHNGHKVVVCFRHATPSHYHHYAWLLACVEHEKCLPGISCRECV